MNNITITFDELSPDQFTAIHAIANREQTAREKTLYLGVEKLRGAITLAAMRQLGMSPHSVICVLMKSKDGDEAGAVELVSVMADKLTTYSERITELEVTCAKLWDSLDEAGVKHAEASGITEAVW